jgi:hypothetical protein
MTLLLLQAKSGLPLRFHEVIINDLETSIVRGKEERNQAIFCKWGEGR